MSLWLYVPDQSMCYPSPILPNLQSWITVTTPNHNPLQCPYTEYQAGEVEIRASTPSRGWSTSDVYTDRTTPPNTYRVPSTDTDFNVYGLTRSWLEPGTCDGHCLKSKHLVNRTVSNWVDLLVLCICIYLIPHTKTESYLSHALLRKFISWYTIQFQNHNSNSIQMWTSYTRNPAIFLKSPDACKICTLLRMGKM